MKADIGMLCSWHHTSTSDSERTCRREDSGKGEDQDRWVLAILHVMTVGVGVR